MYQQRQGAGVGGSYKNGPDYPHDPAMLFCGLCSEQYVSSSAYLKHSKTAFHKKRESALPQKLRSEYLRMHIDRVKSFSCQAHHTRIARDLGAVRSTDTERAFFCMVCDNWTIGWKKWRAHLNSGEHSKKLKGCENLMYIQKLEEIIIENASGLPQAQDAQSFQAQGFGTRDTGLDCGQDWGQSSAAGYMNRSGMDMAYRDRYMSQSPAVVNRDSMDVAAAAWYQGIGPTIGNTFGGYNDRSIGKSYLTQSQGQMGREPTSDYDQVLTMFGNLGPRSSGSSRSQVLAGIMAGDPQALSKVEKWVLEAAIHNDRVKLSAADSDLVMALGYVQRQVLMNELHKRKAALKKKIVLEDILAGKQTALLQVESWLLVAVLQDNMLQLAEADPDLVRVLRSVPKQFIKNTLKNDPELERKRIINCIRAGSRAALLDVDLKVLKAVMSDNVYNKSRADPELVAVLEQADKELVYWAMRQLKKKEQEKAGETGQPKKSTGAPKKKEKEKTAEPKKGSGAQKKKQKGKNGVAKDGSGEAGKAGGAGQKDQQKKKPGKENGQIVKGATAGQKSQPKQKPGEEKHGQAENDQTTDKKVADISEDNSNQNDEEENSCGSEAEGDVLVESDSESEDKEEEKTSGSEDKEEEKTSGSEDKEEEKTSGSSTQISLAMEEMD